MNILVLEGTDSWEPAWQTPCWKRGRVPANRRRAANALPGNKKPPFPGSGKKALPNVRTAAFFRAGPSRLQENSALHRQDIAKDPIHSVTLRPPRRPS